jgi:hypothetical protein
VQYKEYIFSALEIEKSLTFFLQYKEYIFSALEIEKTLSSFTVQGTDLEDLWDGGVDAGEHLVLVGVHALHPLLSHEHCKQRKVRLKTLVSICILVNSPTRRVGESFFDYEYLREFEVKIGTARNVV